MQLIRRRIMLLELEAVGERFYFCPENSLFTFDKEYQSTSERPNVDDMLTKVKMTSYCFCLAISDRCNPHCSYCFNKAKTGKPTKGYTISSPDIPSLGSPTARGLTTTSSHHASPIA